MTVSVKFCVDCRHYEHPPDDYRGGGYCHRPSFVREISMVSGEVYPPPLASMQRYRDETLMWAGVTPTCGPEGKFFEPYPEAA